MFDLKLQVRLKQGQNALKDGRLDEAFAIATEGDIRSLRGGQVLLEDLVDPLLDRASAHFAGGRLREAILDVERAIQAGGNRPRAAQLRKDAREALDAKDTEGRRERQAIESARAHLKNGSLRTGLEALAEASPDSPEAAKFRREVESRERKGEEARARARAHLERSETDEALSALEEAVRACPRHEEMPELRASVKKRALEAMERAFGEGDLEGARGALARLRIVAEEGLEMRRLAEALELAEEAARALRRGEFEAARRLAGRLQKARPGTAWVDEALRELTSIANTLPAIESGPLGRAPRGGKGAPGISLSPSLETLAGQSPVGGGRAAVAPRSRLLLWVDGVGTYLLLDTDRISIGRAGSSARPDIALGADLAGYHAEVLRVDDDYFVVAAQGTVAVGGKPVSRKLLSSGDSLQIGQSCRFSFHLPTALSPTAILSLGQHRIDGDVRKVILLGGHLLLGPGEACHVRTPQKGGVVVLSAAQGRIVCRAEDEILVDGRPAGRETEVPLGSHVQVGEVTFTITDFVHGR